jgi:hypothetical protein
MRDIAGQTDIAKSVSEQMLLHVCDLSHGNIDENVVLILQKFRNEFVVNLIQDPRLNLKPDLITDISFDKEAVPGKKSQSEISASSVAVSFWSLIDDTRIDEIQKVILEQDVQITMKRRIPKQTKYQYLSSYNGHIASYDAIENYLSGIRRVIVTSSPILLSDLVSGPGEILYALERIFRIYVRGYALAGQRISGNLVEIDGRPIPFLKFLLSGPYLSWTGFLSILKDFNIAGVSSLDASADHRRSFKVSYDSSQNQERSLSDHSAPLDLKQAACVFIESSYSCNPALTLEKYVDEYEVLSNKQEFDSWDVVYDWLWSQGHDIKAGLNFMQFIDCFGVSLTVRLASVPYICCCYRNVVC